MLPRKGWKMWERGQGRWVAGSWLGKDGLGSVLGEGILWFPRLREELQKEHNFEGRDEAGQ